MRLYRPLVAPSGQTTPGPDAPPSMTHRLTTTIPLRDPGSGEAASTTPPELGESPRKGASSAPRPCHDSSTVPVYHLHDTAGDDLGLLEHPATNVEPGD